MRTKIDYGTDMHVLIRFAIDVYVLMGACISELDAFSSRCCCREVLVTAPFSHHYPVFPLTPPLFLFPFSGSLPGEEALALSHLQ